MAVVDAEEFGAGPVFGEFFKVGQRRNAVKEAAGDENVCDSGDGCFLKSVFLQKKLFPQFLSYQPL